MGRPVGGAGAGCGGVGLLGLLVSVGIVVWLGSQAFDGTLGGGGRAATTATERSPSSTTVPTTGPTPLALLGEGVPVPADQPATLAVQGATPGPAAVAACAAAGVAAGESPPAEACGPTMAGIEVGADGAGSAPVIVPGSVALADRTVDCRAEPCALIVRTPDGRTAVASIVLAG